MAAPSPTASGPPFTGRKTARGELVVLAGVALVAAVALWLSLPSTVIVFNDDFGYVRSIVETLQRGRPWTDDWLAPWAASLSVLSAGVFKLTGSFRLAVYGLQAALAGVAVMAGGRLLRDRGLSLPAAVGWSLAGLSVPTMLWKYSEFGAVPLYIACLLIVIRAAEQKRWVLFGLVWLVALSSRQSALMWLALPAGHLLERSATARSGWGRTAAGILLLGVAGALVYLTLHAGMNRTHAQTAMTSGLLGNFAAPVFWSNAALTLGFFLVATGVGGFVLGTTSPAASSLRQWFGRAAACVVILALWFTDVRRLIEFEHPYWRDGPGAVSFHILFLVSLVGWGTVSFRPRWANLLAAAALACLLGLRGVLWEYYLLDVAVLGFLGVRSVADPERGGGRTRVLTFASYGVLVCLLWAQTGVAQAIKRLLDQNSATVLLCERGLRSGLIEPSELSVAPFGYQGWQLYPHYVANEGASGGYIANFTNYLRPDALRLDIAGPNESVQTMVNGKLRPGETVLTSTVGPWPWSQRRRFTLIRRADTTAAVWRLDPAHFRREYFPLNDEEWRRFIAGKHRD